MPYLISIVQNSLGLVSWLLCDLSWRIFNVQFWMEYSIYIYIYKVHLVWCVIYSWCFPIDFSSDWFFHWCKQMLKSTLLLLSISPFTSVNIFFIYFGASMMGTYIYKCCIFLLDWALYHYVVILFVFYCSVCFKVCFI